MKNEWVRCETAKEAFNYLQDELAEWTLGLIDAKEFVAGNYTMKIVKVNRIDYGKAIILNGITDFGVLCINSKYILYPPYGIGDTPDDADCQFMVVCTDLFEKEIKGLFNRN